MLMTFLPWIAQSLLAQISTPLSLFVPLVLSSLSLFKNRYVMEWTTFFFFTTGTAISIIAPHAGIEHDISLLSTITLSCVAWGSLLIGKPFTLSYARKQAPQQAWNSRLFMRINVYMTIIFGIMFLFETAMKLLRLWNPERLPYSVVSYCNALCMYLFIKFFPPWYRNRYQNNSFTRGT